MNIYEESTSLINIEQLTPAELGLICYGLQEIMPRLEEDQELLIRDDCEIPIYLPPEQAKLLFEKIKKICIRDEMHFRMGVDPEIVKIA